MVLNLHIKYLNSSMNRKCPKHRKTQKAFTLMELIIILTLILVMIDLAAPEIRNQRILKNEKYLTENLDTIYKYTLDTVRATRNYDETKMIVNLQEGLTNIKTETRSGYRYVDYEKDNFKDIDGSHYIYILHNGTAFKDDLENINTKNTIFVVVTKIRVEIYYTTDTIAKPIIYKKTNV